MEKNVGNWDRTKNVEKDEHGDGMYSKCRDVGRGSIELC